ncbi:MAG: molybdopterin-dependent oxidoreductase [bacterium]|nr:molybdopterin-dependent oxidoreductase [bacterium]
MSEETFDELEMETERYELREPMLVGLVKPDRRFFVQAAGSGLMLAATFTQPPRLRAQQGRSARRDEPLADRFHLGEDGIVTVFTSKVEVGQGSRTQLTQAAAEELGLPIERVQLVMADTSLCPNDGGTAGSRTTPSTVPRVRNAAAAIRNLLLKHAATRLEVPVTKVSLSNGIFAAGERQVTLAELAADENLKQKLATATANANEELKPVTQWKILGTSVPKVTARAVATGSAIYPSDVRRPGMLYGKVLRPVSFGAELLSIDLQPASAWTEVRVVREDQFVACVAPTSYAANQALNAIASTAKWNRPPHVSSDELFEHFKQTGDTDSDVSEQADISRSLTDAHHKIDTAYTIDYIQHAPMEPRAAVAEWNGRELTVWVGTQQPDRVHGELTQAFSLPAAAVRVIVPDTGGGFGGKHTGEVAVEAARMSKAVGKPVSLRWSREEEFTWAYFRPAGLIEVKAGLNSDGKLTVWDFANYNSGGSAIETPYRVSNSSTRFIRCDSPLRQGSYRALASTANTFARESVMDELAGLAGADPLLFRLQHLDDGRLKNVLLAAAKSFGWETAAGQLELNRGVGLACGTEKGSFVAACAEVEVSKNKIQVLRVTQAFECGAIQNPDNLRSQVEGALVQGLGATLFESIGFKNGQIDSDNFSSYRVPRMDDLPVINIELIDRPDLPSVGGSETPIIAIAPAVANAVARASGIRCRSLPFKLS